MAQRRRLGQIDEAVSDGDSGARRAAFGGEHTEGKIVYGEIVGSHLTESRRM